MLRYAFIVFIALDRSGTIAVLPEEFSFWVMWLIVAHLGFSVILSLLSKSKYEKMTLAPYTFAMGVLSLLIALQSVSYTHLDVYKRQVKILQRKDAKMQRRKGAKEMHLRL